MSKIEIYEDCKRISQLGYLLPYIIITAIITFYISIYVATIIIEQHNQEPTKESCIEYFSNYTE